MPLMESCNPRICMVCFHGLLETNGTVEFGKKKSDVAIIVTESLV